MRPSKNDEQGIIIVLVAVFMLGAVGAMAALSIDVVTLYTARSEAQLAADAGALAGARALANSGATSDATGALMALAEPIASKVAIQVAQSSAVAGRDLVAANGEVTVSFSDSATNPCVAVNPVTNPCVTVAVQRTDLPTFFARIWGSTQIKVVASATAEAFNPTNITGAGVNSNLPVATTCVKPWLVPNIDPTSPPGAPATIFDPVSGAVTSPGALLSWTTGGPPTGLRTRCQGTCSTTPAPRPLAPPAWRYYPGNPSSFPVPVALPACAAAFTQPYEKSIAGCVQMPISCNDIVEIDNSDDLTRNLETANAVNCLTHASNGGNTADTITPQGPPPPTVPLEFVAGTNNPIPGASGNNIMVSDSLVTVPVIDATTANWPPPNFPQVQIIGFVQLFLNADGSDTATNGGNIGRVKTTIVNMIGCGTSSSGTPVLGNGGSAVAVRLISPN